MFRKAEHSNEPFNWEQQICSFLSFLIPEQNVPQSETGTNNRHVSIIVLPAMAFTEGEQSVLQISFPYIVPL